MEYEVVHLFGWITFGIAVGLWNIKRETAASNEPIDETSAAVSDDAQVKMYYREFLREYRFISYVIAALVGALGGVAAWGIEELVLSAI